MAVTPSELILLLSSLLQWELKMGIEKNGKRLGERWIYKRGTSVKSTERNTSVERTQGASGSCYPSGRRQWRLRQRR